MELTRAEINKVYGERKGPSRVHVSAAPGATRDQVLAELARVEVAISAGDFDIVKDVDRGTISFTCSYRAFRGIGWSRARSVAVAAWRKVLNICKSRHI